MKKVNVSMVALGVAAAISPAAYGAGVLVDPGFEGSLVDDGSGVGKWQPFSDGSAGNQAIVSTDNPRTGAQSLRLELDNGNGFTGVFQDVPVMEGGGITFSGWNALSEGASGGSEIRIEFIDGGGNEISRTGNLVPTVTAPYTEFSLSDTVPAGAATARVVYAIQSFGAAPPMTIDVDDIDVSGSGVIPEPSGALLVGMSLLGFLVKRRR